MTSFFSKIETDSREGLELLNARVRFSVESALREEISDEKAKMITARIIGEGSWKNALMAAQLKKTPAAMQRKLFYYLFRDTPKPVQMYHMGAAIHGPSGLEKVDRVIESEINQIMDGDWPIFINTSECETVDYLDLIYKNDPKLAFRIAQEIPIPDIVKRASIANSFCLECEGMITPFGRCRNPNCQYFLEKANKDEDTVIGLLDPYDSVITMDNGQEHTINLSPFIEELISKVDGSHELRSRIVHNGLIDDIYHGIFSRFFNIGTIRYIKIDAQQYVRWRDKQRDYFRPMTCGKRETTIESSPR